MLVKEKKSSINKKKPQGVCEQRVLPVYRCHHLIIVDKR